MSALTIRNLPEDVHLALKHRAKQHGKSTEAEVRAILEEAVRPKRQGGLGTALHEWAMQYGGFELDITRDPAPAQGAEFE